MGTRGRQDRVAIVDDERRRIIEAAAAVLERSEFEGFKVQVVLRRAGVSARTFYRHFTDKEALLLALLEDEMTRAGPRLRAAVARADGPIEQVSIWIASIIGAAGDPKRIARARLFTAQPLLMREHPVEMAAGTELLVAPLKEAIERGIETGLFPWANAARDAALIFTLTGNTLTQALSAQPTRTVEDLVADATSFTLRGLGVPPNETPQ